MKSALGAFTEQAVLDPARGWRRRSNIICPRPPSHFLQHVTGPRKLLGVKAQEEVGSILASCGHTESIGFKRSQAGEALREWVLENEGHIHPGLAVVENAPCCGGRGLVATEAISAEDTANTPLVLVPDALYLTSQVARVGFQHYENMGAPSLAELDTATQLAVLLAHEAGEGSDSFYAPYIAALPREPPNAWAMSDAQLDSSLSALAERKHAAVGTPFEEWRADAIATRAALEGHCEALHKRHKQYFRSEVTPETYFWAMGMVVSRAFSTHPQLGLAPFIDTMNHAAGADHPEPVRVNADEEEDIYFYVTAARDGFPAALKPGEELCIQYIDGRTAPKEAWLSYGFVPPELWNGHRSAS